MAEIINCPGCGAEISDDCGNCLLCGKEIKAGAYPAASVVNEEPKREPRVETMSGGDKPQQKKRSAFDKPSDNESFKGDDLEKSSAPRENVFRNASFINGSVRPASLAASICMLFFSIAGFSLAVAISIVIGVIALFSGPGRYGGGVSEQYLLIFAFAFLAANAVTGGNLGYRAGRFIARAFGMDIGGGPGPSSDFLWGGYAGGFLCAFLFSLMMPQRNNYGGRDGEELLFIYFFVCVIAVIAGIYLALARRAVDQKNSGPGEFDYDRNISGKTESEEVPGGRSDIFANGWFRDLSGCFVSALMGAYASEAAAVQFMRKSGGLNGVIIPSYVWLFFAGAIGAIAGISIFLNYRKTVLITKENGGVEGFLRDCAFFIICALIFSAALRNIFYFMMSLFLRNLDMETVICVNAGLETIGAYIGVNFGLALNRNLALNFSRVRSAPQSAETMIMAAGHGFLGWLGAFIFSYMAFGVFYESLTVSARGASGGYYVFHFAVTVVTSLAVSAGMYYGIENQKRK